jgi:hypothetical protein
MDADALRHADSVNGRRTGSCRFVVAHVSKSGNTILGSSAADRGGC